MTEKTTTRKKRAVSQPLSLRRVVPSTDNQLRAFQAYDDGQHLMLSGLAGTGKTFISLYMALKDVASGRYNRVNIVRSIVPTRDPGFLPGTLREKTKVYEAPYAQACADLYGAATAYEKLCSAGTVEFMTTSYLRGITLSDCVVVVDEVQNMKFHEIDSIITRIGPNCRVIVLGDYRQSDLVRNEERQGIKDFLQVVHKMPSFSLVEFGVKDILRSDTVREFILAKDELGL